MIDKIVDFFVPAWSKVALAAGLLAALVGARALDKQHQQSIGAETATKKITEATSNAANLGAKAAAKSVAPAAGGVRKYPTDPTTRD